MPLALCFFMENNQPSAVWVISKPFDRLSCVSTKTDQMYIKKMVEAMTTLLTSYSHTIRFLPAELQDWIMAIMSSFNSFRILIDFLGHGVLLGTTLGQCDSLHQRP